MMIAILIILLIVLRHVVRSAVTRNTIAQRRGEWS